jgi:hypothetical protein
MQMLVSPEKSFGAAAKHRRNGTTKEVSRISHKGMHVCQQPVTTRVNKLNISILGTMPPLLNRGIRSRWSTLLASKINQFLSLVNWIFPGASKFLMKIGDLKKS